jgi:hypothetical protein
MGFTVNEQKSFMGGSCYRESCGIYAYNGVDVTPVLFRVKSFQQGRLDAQSFASLVACVNRLGDFGFLKARSYLINRMKRTFTYGNLPKNACRYLPFTRDRNEWGIYSTVVYRAHVVREHRDWQRTEKKVLLIKPFGKGTPSPLADQYGYDQWMRARIRGGSIEDQKFSIPRVRPSTSRITLGWTPV